MSEMQLQIDDLQEKAGMIGIEQKCLKRELQRNLDLLFRLTTAIGPVTNDLQAALEAEALIYHEKVAEMEKHTTPASLSKIRDKIERGGAEGRSEVMSEIVDAQNFVDSLPDSCYEVIKVNNMGRRQKRQLRFTTTHIENVRGKVASKAFTYEDVVKVVQTDHQTLKIGYNSDHDFTYRSPMVHMVVQDLTKRIQLRHAINKKKLTFGLALRFQEKQYLGETGGAGEDGKDGGGDGDGEDSFDAEGGGEGEETRHRLSSIKRPVRSRRVRGPPDNVGYIHVVVCVCVCACVACVRL